MASFKKILVILGIFFSFVLLFFFAGKEEGKTDKKIEEGRLRWWEVQSIDTVKYSRDLAREKLKDASFDKIIDRQVSLIAETGATHVAIGTPYDESFLPFLKRWVAAARKYHLTVWFRGNFSGWEGWFGYKRIERKDHIRLTRDFILNNPEIFEAGDIFSACPECENGGPGDPRTTGDVKGYQEFLVEEYRLTNDAFRKIGRNVRSNFIPMNADVARVVMDEATTKALGGIVVIDHYVSNSKKLAQDISDISEMSGGKVVLGEFGAPIPNIHGNLNERQQAQWVKEALYQVSSISKLVGVNYWTSFGGSSELWNTDFSQRGVVSVIHEFYKPNILRGRVINELGAPIEKAKLTLGKMLKLTNEDGSFEIAYLSNSKTISAEASSYKSKTTSFKEGINMTIVLEKERESFIFRLQKLIHKLINKRVISGLL